MSPPQRRLRWTFLAALLPAFLVLPLSPSFPAAAASDQPDWVVSTPTILNDTVKEVRADLTVESGGELRLVNSTLVMNCSREGEFVITVKAGGRLIADRSNITCGPSGNRYWFLVNGTMQLADCELSGTRGQFDSGGIFITSSNVSITRCRLFDHQWYAILIKGTGTSPTISNCTIEMCKSGIRVEGGGAPTIAGNTIQNNERDGITVLNSNPAIRNNRILNNWKGIGLYQSKPEVSGNEISGSGLLGIDCSDFADATITGNTISGSGQAGISVYFSAPRILSNTISSNGIGINSTASKPVMTGNTIGGNRGWGIYCKGGSPALDGNSLRDSRGNPNALGGVAVAWNLELRVQDSSQKPVPEADVTITDRSGNTVYRGRTGDGGNLSGIELLQMHIDESGEHADTPHRVSVTWKDLSDTLDVTMDKDQEVTARLGGQKAKGFLPGPDVALTMLAICIALLVLRNKVQY